jgi:hypothetical protein
VPPIDTVTVGIVASRRIVVELVAVPPVDVAVHVRTVPAAGVLLEMVVTPHPVLDVIGVP